MADTIDKIVKQLVKAVPSKSKTAPYDTQAVVKKIEGDTAWVHIPGGVEVTPVKLTTNAKKGDTVQVRISGGRAWLYGNVTSPPTDDTKATQVDQKADKIQVIAIDAKELAESANMYAGQAKDAADRAEESASAAQLSADSAAESASNASKYASTALGNLSTVQSVTETLTWITQHGTMALTSDTALDPTHVYFVVDANGDYVVGNTHYSIVSEPDIDDISTYYELIIDESLNNYVGSHLALTNDGLYILKDESEWKVLIADDGVYILDDSNTAVAKYKNDITIGIDDGTQSYLYENYHSLQMIDKEGNTYFHVSDLRDENGEAEITNIFIADGTTQIFNLAYIATNTNYIVKVNGIEVTPVIKFDNQFGLSPRPSAGDEITVTYTTTSANAKCYTFGLRDPNGLLGGMSVCEGIGNVASGTFSHAEGQDNTASGNYGAHAEGLENEAHGDASHAEGYLTEAFGIASHSQGYGTIAKSRFQTAIGKHNEADNNDTYALIIGNGTSEANRSNALTVDWNGNVDIAGDLTANGTNITSTETWSPSITRSTGGTISNIVGKQYGKLCMVSFVITYNTSVGAGNNLFTGTLSNNKPAVSAFGAGYYASHDIITQISYSGTITVRNASASAVTVSDGITCTVLYLTT